MLLVDEDSAAFGAFEAAVHAELAPGGALQADLVARIVVAAWRARRADRLEAALLGKQLGWAAASAEGGLQDAPGAELVRDCNGPCTMETLLRYRGSVFAEPFRSLEALKRLQAEAGATQIPASSADALAAPSNLSGTERTREVAAEQ